MTTEEEEEFEVDADSLKAQTKKYIETLQAAYKCNLDDREELYKVWKRLADDWTAFGLIKEAMAKQINQLDALLLAKKATTTELDKALKGLQ